MADPSTDVVRIDFDAIDNLPAAHADDVVWNVSTAFQSRKETMRSTTEPMGETEMLVKESLASKASLPTWQHRVHRHPWPVSQCHTPLKTPRHKEHLPMGAQKV